jgi:hypothetical protein
MPDNVISLSGPVIHAQVEALELKDGGQHVLPDEEWLKRNLRNAQLNLKVYERDNETTQKNKDATEDAKQLSLVRVLSNRTQVAHCELALEDYKASIDQARVFTYDINTPTYDDLLILQDECKVEEKGIPSIDMGKMRKLIRPVLLVVENKELLPSHFERLWERWRREVYPNPSEIPFIFLSL